jgi:hypothetical protein
MADKEHNNIAGHMQYIFDPSAVSILQGIFQPATVEAAKPAQGDGSDKAASVKFMITMQDESDLRNLGYSQPQIDKMKPEEAREIITTGKKAAPPEGH